MDFFKIVYDYIFILQLLIVCISLIIIFYKFEKTWKSILIALIEVVILFVIGTLLNYGLFELSQVFHPLAGINFPISWVLLILFYLIFVKTPVVNRLLMGGTLFVTVYAIINIGRQLIFVTRDSFPSGIIVIIYIFIIFYSIVLHKLSLKEYTDLPIQSVVMMFIITICLSALLIGKEAYNVITHFIGFDDFYLFTLMAIYTISVCSYLMLYFYAKARKSMVHLQVENKLLEADKERIESFETAREEFHLLRHDLYNQMNILQIMLENENYGELQKYFDSMYANLIHNKEYDYIECGNSIINSVINMEILKAKRSNIVMKTNIIVPNELPFESSDICRILVNLIDNAIEASLRMKDENKDINISILTHGEYLYIGVQNKVSHDSNPDKLLRMNTEKEDQANHGFGHRIVKKIARKYNGHVNYSIENDIFIAEVMLDINYSKEKVK